MISHMSSYSVLAQNISKGEIDFLVNFLDRVAFMILSVKKEDDWVAIEVLFENDFDLKKSFSASLLMIIEKENKPEMKSLLSKCKVLNTSTWRHNCQWPPIWKQAQIADLQ